MLDGYSEETILDTGAVTCVINAEALEKILGSKQQKDWKIRRADEATGCYDIIAAEGSSLKAIDVADIPIQWGTKTPKFGKFMVAEA